MSLRFIYGRAGSGKTTYCLKDIKRKIDNNESGQLIMLVPEQFSFQAGKNMLEYLGEKGMAKVKVLSFKRMAYMVFSETGGLYRRYMSSSGKVMLIYSVLQGIKKDLKYYSIPANKQGFSSNISDIITEFKRYNVSPEILQMAMGKVEDEGLKDKLFDIDLIYRNFENEIKDKYIDSNDDLTILSEKLDECHIFDGAEIWIDEFSSFTPQEYLVLEKLLKKSKRINITLCSNGSSGFSDVERTDVFATVIDTENKFINICRDNNVPIDKGVYLKCEPCVRFADSVELNHLEKNYFAYPYSVYKKETTDISIFKASNRFSEITHVARSIVSLVREKGLRFKDIAVLTRDIDGYEKIIGALFKEHNIPYFIDKKRDISSNPLIVMVLSSLEILSKGWSYESVFRYLKTGLTGISSEDIDFIENYVLAAGIKGKRWTEDKKWTYIPRSDYSGRKITEDEKRMIDRVNSIRNSITEPLLSFEKELRVKNTAYNYCMAIYNFLYALNIPERIGKNVDELKEKGDLLTAEEYERVFNMLMDVLDQSVEILKGNEITLDNFTKILSVGLMEEEIGVIPPSLDQVIVGSVDRIRNHGARAVFIVGVNDGVFPLTISDGGILSDEDRESLKDIGVELASDSKSKVFEEGFIIYRTLSTSSKYLNLSYPIADHEGKALRPSIIIGRIKKIFPKIKEESNIVEEKSDRQELQKITSPDAAFKELIVNMRRFADGENINPIWIDVYKWYKLEDHWSEKCSRALSALSYTNQVKTIKTDKAKELYEDNKSIKTSVSKLEKYASCPFAFFLEYGLRARERKLYELTFPDIGSLIHAVLDKLLYTIEKEKIQWKDIDEGWCKKKTSLIVDDLLLKNPSILKSSKRYDYVVKKLKRMVTKAVMVMVYQINSGTFRPNSHEVVFKDGGNYPSIKINLKSGQQVELTGRIDRMDELTDDGEVFFRIVDYKSGNKKFSLSDIYNGIEMQLLVYMDAVIEYAEKTGKKYIPGGILYFRVDDPIIKSRGELSEEKIKTEVLKKLKMDGLILSDIKVIKDMDENVGKTSFVIPVSLNADGSISKSSSTASEEEFELLRKHVRNKIMEFCSDMLDGVITIRPYKKGKELSCKYCSFMPICKFDPSISDNRYSIIRDYSKSDVFDMMKNEKNSMKEGE